MLRKKSILIAFIVLIGLFTLNCFANSTSLNPHIGGLPIQTWTTEQGVQVFFVHSPELPMLDIHLIFPAGSINDGEQFGLAGLTNAMLITGTQSLNADRIATQFDQLGALFINEVTQDYAVLGLRSLSSPESLMPALKLFAQILATPNFPDKQFHRLQKQTLIAIQANAQAPGSVANDLFFKSLYGQQGYAHPSLGTQQTVSSLTRNDLIQFYRHYYLAKDASLILVGNITNTQAKDISQQLSQAILAKPIKLITKNTVSAPPTTQESAHCQQFDFPSTQANILMGEIGISRKDPDYFPLLIGNHILGGSSLTSRLFQEVRNKKGLVYSVYSGFMPLKEKGPFLIELQSRNEKASESIQTIQETLSKFLKEGVSNEELNSAKRNLIGKFNVNLASNRAITQALSYLAFYQLPLDYFDNYPRKIEEVTLQEVKTAMKNHLHPARFLTVIVGKASCPKLP